jgi:broad specificity phosphatase PhoE
MTELYLIRHGNARKLAGESYATAPLTELGREQSALTGDYLAAQSVHFDGYFCSPLRRAVETAKLIGERLGRTAQVRYGLEEMEYHEVPLTIACEIAARTGILNRYFDARIGKPLRYPMLGRVAAVMLSLLTQHPEGTLGIVAHGGVVSSILAWYFPRERRRWWHEVGNCSITRLSVSHSGATLLVYDQVNHLQSLAPQAHKRNYTFSGDDGL